MHNPQHTQHPPSGVQSTLFPSLICLGGSVLQVVQVGTVLVCILAALGGSVLAQSHTFLVGEHVAACHYFSFGKSPLSD